MSFKQTSRQKRLDEYNDAINLNLNYVRNAGEQFVWSCIKKRKRNIWKEIQVKFVATYNTTEAF